MIPIVDSLRCSQYFSRTLFQPAQQLTVTVLFFRGTGAESPQLQITQSSSTYPAGTESWSTCLLLLWQTTSSSTWPYQIYEAPWCHDPMTVQSLLFLPPKAQRNRCCVTVATSMMLRASAESIRHLFDFVYVLFRYINFWAWRMYTLRHAPTRIYTRMETNMLALYISALVVVTSKRKGNKSKW
jgi:hypothetical protein